MIEQPLQKDFKKQQTFLNDCGIVENEVSQLVMPDPAVENHAEGVKQPIESSFVDALPLNTSSIQFLQKTGILQNIEIQKELE